MQSIVRLLGLDMRILGAKDKECLFENEGGQT